jgi:hypothetical protein
VTRTTNQGPRRATAPIGPHMRGQILSGLREAWRLARNDLGGALPQVRDLLADVLTRMDGVLLPTQVGARTPTAENDIRAGAAPPAQAAMSQLPFAALATARGEPVSEFRLIPYGEVIVERPVAGESFMFTRAHAEGAKRWFDRIGRKLAVDYEHQSFDRFNTRSDGLRPAAGWIGGLEVRDDGLWAINVSWTDRAAELLRSGEYRYFSPVIFWTDEERSDVAALGPVALTNDPAMRGVAALAARRASEPPDAEDALAAARAEAAALRRQLAERTADAFIERGQRAGKIVDSTSADWRADFLRDAELAEARLTRAPVLRPPGRVVTQAPAATVAGRGAAGIARGMTGCADVEPEDLATFAAVAAAGRVLGLT